MKRNKPILCLDFDGVIHSYTSGWRGPRIIPDPPVPGALEFIVGALEDFEVAIFSSRSKYFGGRWAMKRWFKKQLLGISGIDPHDRWAIPLPEKGEIPLWWFNYIAQTAFADPWPDEVRWAIRRLLKQIKFPKSKPAAFLAIDDRAICFQGKFPDPKELLSFKTWTNKGV